MIKFALPYNGDMEFIDQSLSKYGNYIESYFGNLGIDDFGGGRAQTQNIVKKENELKEILDKLNAAGIEFNYVINNNGLMNEEFTEKYHERYLKFINKLVDLGIRKVTLSNPYLIKYTKQELPALKISASVNLKTRSWEELEYLIQLGIDEATLHYDLIKNFGELIRIRSKTDILLKLIPNDLYISNCPWQKGHTRMQGSHSKHKETKTPYFSYYRNKCVNIRNLRPEEIYSGKWIAPVDIPKYMEIGYKNFKLLDRLATTEWIMKSIEIYLEQSRTSHLEEILGTYGSKSNIHAAVSDGLLEQALYPRDQLELIPEISQVDNKIWYSANHTDNCMHCVSCRHAADKGLIYPEDKRHQYIENNRRWQSRITKLPYIKELNHGEVQRIEYK
ncbi:Peptidase family U32 [Anaerocolumna jejuensis DSM 15929]|uniref:Peptidase family U32 n=1 Tax=Anaerocolumna jejuensis DSM 15929 TaxID=1121322 RepID=A0A1M6PVR6_9FIRM|nr:U32 family peptidase [Anaerocolumna jejuensis]SHK12002.1 Peptidase family U32 [Anaerocolumna jejuensis DSM 15929]